MITYNTILRQLAVAVNALVGTLPAQLESTYSTVPLTAASFDDSIFGFSFLKDKMLNAQEGLVVAIASSEKHPWRQFIGPDVTDPLVYAERIPSVAAGGAQIVGAFGAVRDPANGHPCTYKKLQQIRERMINVANMVMPVYWFNIEGDRVYHTRPSVEIDVCTYTRPNSDTLDLTSNIILPDVSGSAIVDGAAMESIRDDEFLSQSQRYGEYYAAWLTAIKAGLTTVEPKPMRAAAEKVA